jgi:hypothetical protein
VADEQQDTPERPADPRERARDLLRRTAPVLRDVNARIDENPALRDTRDSLLDRAGGLVQKADEHLKRMTAIEGTVVDDGSSARPAAAPASTPPRQAPAADEAREPHWTKQRVARMATAAAREAVRPARPIISRDAKWALLGGALLGVFAATVLRRRR